MKRKTAAISMALCFFSCALFAQNQHDTVPQPPRTDTMHRADSTSTTTDTTKASAFVIHQQNSESIAQNTSALVDKNLFAAKENEVTVSAK
jgi:hypothetical protein